MINPHRPSNEIVEVDSITRKSPGYDCLKASLSPGSALIHGNLSTPRMFPTEVPTDFTDEHSRETSLVRFSTVPGCTNPMLSFHPWNLAVVLYTGPAIG